LGDQQDLSFSAGAGAAQQAAAADGRGPSQSGGPRSKRQRAAGARGRS
jgi:hypothetical protein